MNNKSKENHPYGDILVVDDELISLKLLVAFLIQNGYQARSAINGELALHCVQEKQPELILMDYTMPGMNGIELCRQLKGDPETSDIPVMFLSGLEESDLKVQALEAGAIDFISKPIDLSELLVRIKNHLKLFRLQRRLIEEIEERKQAEKKLYESNERFRIAFESSSDCIVIWDKYYNYLYANQATIDQVGIAPDKAIGKNIRDNLGHIPDFMQLWVSRIDQVFATGKVMRVQDERVLDGRLYYTDSSISPLRASDDNIMAVCVVHRDVTEQRKMEDQLFLNEKLSTIAGLAAGVAHEINTPLSAILQAHQLVVMGLSPKEAGSTEKAAEYNVDLAAVQKYFKKNDLDYFMNGIRDSALKAGNIIKRLLEFSRPHEGSFASANLEEIMESSLLLSQADYDMKKKYAINTIQFVKDYYSGTPSLICVATEIEQVIMNLIKNSVQSLAETKTQKKPCITLRIAMRDKKAVLEVEDNGPGIAEDVKRHIFDPFFTTREVGTGTGLGLSVSHAIIVDKHKGDIFVESDPDNGAKFIIELPMNQEVFGEA